MINFKEQDGELFRMLDEPVPLTPDAEMPCLVRLIQDDSPMGMFNKDASYSDVIGKLFVAQKIKENPFYSNTLHAYEKNSLNQDYCIASIHTLEIIGCPVDEGSRWWALYQMMQGKKVSYKGAIGNVYLALNQDGNVQYYDMDNLAYIGTIRSKLEFGKKDVAKTGWQLYKEPEPEPKERPLRNLILRAKEQGMNIRTWYQDLIFTPESLTSYLNNGKYRWWNIGDWELTKREANMPMPEPEPPREPDYVICKRCGGTGYEIKPEPDKDQFEVGDWVECIAKQGQRKLVDYLGGMGCYKTNYGEVISPGEILRKLKPSEIVVRIGCLSGTVRPVSTNGIHIWFHLIGVDDKTIATIRISSLDAPTRGLVEGLLKAQIKENA